MTDQKHPITPPPELVMQWFAERHHHQDYTKYPISQAARWGADQELEACSNFLERELWGWGEDLIGDLIEKLHADRRPEPKPLSLKEQALAALSEADQGLNESEWKQRSATIRRALESLPD